MSHMWSSHLESVNHKASIITWHASHFSQVANTHLLLLISLLMGCYKVKKIHYLQDWLLWWLQSYTSYTSGLSFSKEKLLFFTHHLEGESFLTGANESYLLSLVKSPAFSVATLSIASIHSLALRWVQQCKLSFLKDIKKRLQKRQKFYKINGLSAINNVTCGSQETQWPDTI